MIAKRDYNQSKTVSLVAVSSLLIAVLLFATVSFTPGVSAVSSSTLVISINGGVLQFPGETAVFYFTTTANGNVVNPSNITVTLYFPNNTNSLVLTATQVTTGLYIVTWAIPDNAVTGYYALAVYASYESGTFAGYAVQGFEISQGLQNNQNQVMSGIGGLSSQLSSVESNILSYDSQVISAITSVQTAIQANHNQTMQAMGELSTQLASVESNVLATLNASAKAGTAPVAAASGLLGAYLLPWAPALTAQVFGFALLALITIVILLSTGVLVKRQSAKLRPS